jgi:outer membrane protein OmpA-like peptidoglycan-associated protein
MGWLPWLLLAVLLLALIFFGLRYCSRQDAAVPVGSDGTVSETTGSADAGAAGSAAGAATAVAIPEGAGVIAADRAGKPMLSVYFDTGKSEVSNDLSTAASAVKAYLDSHAGATLAVSGFNDPSGNAAANAELSKTRAQNVKAAIEALGIAADKVVLEKPADTTAAAAGAGYAGARRVEVTVKD